MEKWIFLLSYEIFDDTEGACPNCFSLEPKIPEMMINTVIKGKSVSGDMFHCLECETDSFLIDEPSESSVLDYGYITYSYS